MTANFTVDSQGEMTALESLLPALSPVIRLALVDDGCVAYDTIKEEVHRLNTTAALILTFCDGRHTVGEVKDAVARCVGAETETNLSVDAWLLQAVANGLIAWQSHSDQPVPYVEMNADDLADLAERLRNEGHFADAYCCQRRATELDSDNSQLWYDLGDYAQVCGDRLAAQHAYERFLELEPQDPEIRQILCALRAEPAPPRASDEFVSHVFDSFADHYDDTMRDELGYRAPEIILERLKPFLPPAEGQLNVADLGCGTGLVGPLLRPWARRLAGVDLSHDMVAEAAKRKVYDSFHLSELTEWFGAEQATFDLMVACDVFIYFGDLTTLLRGAHLRLSREGLVAFSVEKGIGDVTLTDSGRYSHSRQHIVEAVSSADLDLIDLTEHVFRYEHDLPVTGLFAILGHKASRYSADRSLAHAPNNT